MRRSKRGAQAHVAMAKEWSSVGVRFLRTGDGRGQCADNARIVASKYLTVATTQRTPFHFLLRAGNAKPG